MKRILVVALSLLTAACATPAPSTSAPSAGPAPSAGVNPVGTFNFITSGEGDEIRGTIEIAGSPGAYTGHVRTPHDDIPISRVMVAGQEMTVTANTPDGPLTLTLIFTGSTFTGGWTVGEAHGPLTGQRAP